MFPRFDVDEYIVVGVCFWTMNRMGKHNSGKRVYGGQLKMLLHRITDHRFLIFDH